MRRLIVALVALVALAAAGASSAAPAGPLAPSTDLAGDMGGARAVDGPSTPTGFHLACVSGRHVVIVQPLRNVSRLPLTLTGAALDPPSARIVRRVAVQFRLAPRPPKGRALVLGIRPWSAASPASLTVAPGREAWVQSNFVLSGCQSLGAHALVANRELTLTFRTGGRSGSERIATPWTQIVLVR